VAFQRAILTLDKHMVRTITNGKSAQFPKTWKATAEYHTAGQEMLGNDIDTSEVVTPSTVCSSRTSASTTSTRRCRTST
jgi:hypothetical protein